jgi:hypothetical protein
MSRLLPFAHLDLLELDLLVGEVLEQARPRSEEHRHEVNRQLVDQAGLDIRLLVISAPVASRQFSSWNMGMYEMPTIAPSGDCSLVTV